MEEGGAEGLLESLGQGTCGTGGDGGEVKQEYEAYDGYAYHGEECPELFVAEQGIAALDAEVVVEGEVDATDQHEDAGNILDI